MIPQDKKSELDSILNSKLNLEFQGCPICKQPDTIIVDPKSTDIVCSKCGVVLSDRMDIMLDWQIIDRDEIQSSTRTRTGPPISLARHDMGLSTVIGTEKIDSNKNQISSSMLSTIQRIRTWDLRTRYNKNHTLRIAFSELDALKDKLGLSERIVEKAAYIFRKAQGRGIIRGRTISAVIAAALYIACRQMEVPRTLEEIAAASNISWKSMAKSHRELVFELELLPIIDNKKCIVRVANKANVSEKTKYKAVKLMNEVVNGGISVGKDPMGLAAAVLYISCVIMGEEKTQTDLASAGQITDVTIRNRIKDLTSKLGLHN